MQLTFRLQKVLQDHGAWSHGAIKRICDATGLERHLVSRLLEGKFRTISREVLQSLCTFLHDQVNVAADDLPGILFAIQPGGFWEMLAHCQVEISVGVRNVARVEPRWVNAYDAFLQGKLLQELFGVVGRAPRAGGAADDGVSPGPRSQAFSDLHLVPAYSRRRDLQRTRRSVERIHKKFHLARGDRAMVCVGSVKANPLVEAIVAEAFDAEPFVSQDGIADPCKRAAPFYLYFRETDPRPPSCHGGRRLAKSDPTEDCGIYYEDEQGNWMCCPVGPARDGDDAKTTDAGLVFYVYRPGQGTFEMVLAGFTGVATGALGLELHRMARQFWPPVYDRGDLQIGAYVVRFEFKRRGIEAAERQPILVKPSRWTVIPLSAAAIARRLGPEAKPRDEDDDGDQPRRRKKAK